jgi:uncharacterized membrane protein YvlD (DUF360 family)
MAQDDRSVFGPYVEMAEPQIFVDHRREVRGFSAALIGSLLYSVCGMVIDAATERLFSRSAA